MNYKIFLVLLLFVLSSCEHHKAKIIYKKDDNDLKKNTIIKEKAEVKKDQKIIDGSKLKIFNNKGFTLIYDDKLFKNLTVNKKINQNSIVIYNKNILINSPVKITNLINGKSLISKIDNTVDYPSFYNSLVSKRVVNELLINYNEPYVQIETINSKDFYVANEVKTFDEEKNVASKVSIDSVIIQNISSDQSIVKNKTKKKQKNLVKKSNFNYIIKFADLYFEDSAIMLKDRLENEFNIKDLYIKKISSTNFRVFKGPFKDLDSLKIAYNDIINLNFENIEILKL